MASGLLRLGPRGPRCSGPVPGRGAPQPEPFLGGPAGLTDAIAVVPEAGPCSVLTGQHRHDVDVIRGVTDRDPADRVVILAVGRQPGPVHDVAGDLRPLVIRERPVTPGGPNRAVPDGTLEPARAERRMRLLEQAVQVAEVAAAIVPDRRLQLGGMPPAGDKVWIGVRLVAARAVQVVDQPGYPRPACADLADHCRSLFRSSSAAWSRSCARRMLSAA
jgi:hypothetical protein